DGRAARRRLGGTWPLDSRRPLTVLHSEEMRADSRLPYWTWMLRATAGVSAVLAWTIWGGTERGTWIGGILIGLSGVLVYALALEALPHEGLRPSAAMRRRALAVS